MTRLIATIIIILTVSGIAAQKNDKTIFVGNVISDTTIFVGNVISDTTTFIGYNDNSILKSKNKIEIRFIISSAFDVYSSYIVLTFNNKWNAKYFSYDYFTEKIEPKDISDTVNIGKIISQLVSNNIFSLPDQNTLKLDQFSYNPETNEFSSAGIVVSDGACYCVEYKVGDRYRLYNYCNPHVFADFYPLIHELRDFANIVEIFNELTKK